MKVTRLVKRVGQVLNVGNYQTVKFESEVEAIIEDTDNLEEANTRLFDIASTCLAKDKKRWQQKRKEAKK